MAEQLNRADIEGILPHRRPFLFLDSATIIEKGHAIGKLSDLTHPDFVYLGGHFPNLPIFPGALLMEALAELSGIAAYSYGLEQEGKVGVLVRDSMEYRQKIIPAEATLAELEAKIVSLRSRMGKAEVKALKDGKIAAQGEISFMMIDKSAWPQ